jgi:hypothetical protein
MKAYMLSALLLASFWAHLAAPPVAWGQQEAATREDVVKLLEVMQVKSQMRNLIDQMAAHARSTGREQAKQRFPDLSDAALSRLDALQDQMFKEVPIDAMMEDVIPIYQRHFTRSDVAAMTGFYSTPAGKKLLQEMPSLTAESNRATALRMQGHMQAFAVKGQQLLEELRKESAQPASP